MTLESHGFDGDEATWARAQQPYVPHLASQHDRRAGYGPCILKGSPVIFFAAPDA